MRITVKMKLGLAFAAVIALSGVTAWLGISNLSSLNMTMQDLVGGPVERIQLAQELKSDLLLVIRAEKNLILVGAAPESRTRYDAEITKQLETNAARLDKIDAIASVEGKKRLAALRVTRQQWIEVNNKVRNFVRDNQAPEALALSAGAGRQLVAEQMKQIGRPMDREQVMVGDASWPAAGGNRLTAVRRNAVRSTVSLLSE